MVEVTTLSTERGSTGTMHFRAQCCHKMKLLRADDCVRADEITIGDLQWRMPC